VALLVEFKGSRMYAFEVTNFAGSSEGAGSSYLKLQVTPKEQAALRAHETQKAKATPQAKAAL